MEYESGGRAYRISFRNRDHGVFKSNLSQLDDWYIKMFP